MKICWDNLERLKFTKNGTFIVYNTTTYYFHENCNNCGDPFIGPKNLLYCDISCSMTINASNKGRYRTNNIPMYDTYASRLEPYGESCRRNPDDPNILEVKCTYCGKWFTPTRDKVRSRIKGINKDDIDKFYCSDYCKQECPLYGKKASSLIKYNKIVNNDIIDNHRDVQSELRELTFIRDRYTCQKCGQVGGKLNCHHIDPVINNPIESADIDNCITLCVRCHKSAHKQKGCGYYELRCNNLQNRGIINEMVTVSL
jgi:hypothetical protein